MSGISLEDFRSRIKGSNNNEVTRTDYLDFLVEKGVLEEDDFNGDRMYWTGIKKIAEFFDGVDKLGN